MKGELKIHPVSTTNCTLFIDKYCHIYELRNGQLTVIGTKFTKIELSPSETVHGYDLFLKTFYGEIDLPVEFDSNGCPFYDLTFASIRFESETVMFINDVEFRQIAEFPDYFISNKGVVVSIVNEPRILKHRLDKDGYHKCTLKMYAIRAIHRLIYVTWIDPTKTLTSDDVIHHKDNVIWHNYPWNLELTTQFQNHRYASEDDLMHRTALTFNWTTERIHELCQMMRDGKSPREIAIHFGVDPDNDIYAYGRLCYCIRRAKYHKPYEAWNDVFSQYDLSQYDYQDQLIPIRHHRARAQMKNFSHTLHDETIQRIRQARANGMGVDELSIVFGVTKGVIEKVSHDLKRNKSLASTTIERVAS